LPASHPHLTGYAHYGAAKAAYKQIAVIPGEQALKHMPHERERRPPGRSTARSAACDLGQRGGAFAKLTTKADSPLEENRFELVWGFSCQVVVFGFSQFFVRSGKAVLHPVACDQVRGARGSGQGTETVAQLGGLPPSVACVSQRLDA
jgi:hypothetical protein